MHTLTNVKDVDTKIQWPTEPIKNLQEKMKNSDVEKNTPECSLCWDAEKIGSPSYRTKYNEFWQSKLSEDKVAKLINEPALTTLDLQFGHLCNLSCVMCSPSLSSHLFSTRNKLIKISKDEKQKQYYERNNSVLVDNVDWTKDPHSYQKVLDLCEPITEIKISGGEPLFNPRFKEFLNYLMTKEKKLFRIHLTTNATTYDPEIVDMLNRIPFVSLKISLESVGAEDEFIRWPTDWNNKANIIKQYCDNLHSEKLFLIASSCIQSLNLFSHSKISNFISSLNNNNIKIQRQPTARTDLASLWHSDNDYIDMYLNTRAKTDLLNDVTKQAQGARQFDKKMTRQQVLLFTEMAEVQGKKLEDVFPLYYQFHKKYL